MNIKTIASGSSGNCYTVEIGEAKFLLDCGLPYRRIMKETGFSLSSFDGCLITHEHQDHAKAAKDLAAQAVNLYASQGTFNALGLSGHRCKQLQPLQSAQIAGVECLPLPIRHDAAEPLGFVLTGNEERLLYLTDTFYCKWLIPNMTHCMIECNYTEAALSKAIKEGTTALEMAKRLRTTHMSLETVMEFFRANDCSKLQEVYLLHLSDRNSNEQEIRNSVQGLCGAKVYIV